jgi:hypothetical protein
MSSDSSAEKRVKELAKDVGVYIEDSSGASKAYTGLSESFERWDLHIHPHPQFDFPALRMTIVSDCSSSYVLTLGFTARQVEELIEPDTAYPNKSVATSTESDTISLEPDRT